MTLNNGSVGAQIGVYIHFIFLDFDHAEIWRAWPLKLFHVLEWSSTISVEVVKGVEWASTPTL